MAGPALVLHRRRTLHSRGGRLRDLRNQRLRCQHQGGDGGGVLQRRAGDLGRVYDPVLEQVAELAGGGVVAVGSLLVPSHIVDDDHALHAGVLGDHPQRLLERLTEDAGAGPLVGGELLLQLVEGGGGAGEGGGAAPGDDPLFDGGAGGGEGVLHAELLLLELHLRGGADLDHGDAAGQLGQPLLELLAVELGGGVVHLGLYRLDAGLDRLVGAVALDDDGVVLGGDDAAGAAEVGHLGVLKLAAHLLGNVSAAGEDGDVLQGRLAAVSERRRLDADGVDRPAQLVHHQGGQRLALAVVADDHQILGHLERPLQHGQQVVDGGQALIGDEDVGVVDDRLHALRVGDEVGGDVAAVYLHPLDELRLQADALPLLDGDDAVLADLLHDIGDDIADLLVVAGDGGDLGDLLLAGDRLGQVTQRRHHGLHAGLDAALEVHRVGAGGHVAHTLADDRLGEDGGGGGAVAGDVVGLGGHLAGELGAHVLERVLEVDLLGDADAVVHHGWGPELPLEHDVAAAGAERHTHGVGQGVDAVPQAAARLLTEKQLFGWHQDLLRRWNRGQGTGNMSPPPRVPCSMFLVACS